MSYRAERLRAATFEVRGRRLSWRALVALVLADIVGWGLVHAGTGYLAHRLDARWLERDRGLLRLLPFEYDGRLARERLRVDRWKDRIPEAGDFFDGGLSKRRLPSRDDQGLTTFVRETRRAELAHWWAMAGGPLLATVNPSLPGLLLIGYGVAVNLPFIVVQRYNRARSLRLLHQRTGRGGGTASVTVATPYGAERRPRPRR